MWGSRLSEVLKTFGHGCSAVLRNPGSPWFLNPAELCFMQKLHCEDAVKFGGLENNLSFPSI